ncbi:hybrid sensor histidine kinase/response regulator transcription factor [Dyadobacter sp. CY312]|uniref:hybrid sensor histidine kinase/response regulator transcription factor n=1 Tax=Dyadobacter sp. CY312 TaxID=2907303 RepID=UPI001F2CB2EB|nr:hybrid sensor histidine kinase/response regulator transcription factor [Dyadobacter sp. CY312]MCE7044510.1 helix-turn-helix domain-containing protein [Dyadobacter sp. CY312]
MNPLGFLSFTARNKACILAMLTVVVCLGMDVFGQKLVFNNLNSENGLSQNSVLAITQDQSGFIWLGTSYGLNKFDGRGFKIYKNNPGDKSTLSGNYVLCALTDSKNDLWFGTSNGLNKYMPESDSFISFLAGDSTQKTRLSSSVINCLFEDSRGILWIGTSKGLNKLTNDNRHGFEFHHQGFEKSDVRSIFEDSSHQLWIGTADGLTKMIFAGGQVRYKKYINSATDKASLTDNFVTSVAEDKQKNIWVGTKHGGLNLYNPRGDNFTHYKSQINGTGLVHNNIRKILVDKNGKLWIGTLEGLSILDPESLTFESFKHEPENRTSLSQNSLYAIFQDKSGCVWIGSYYNGVNVVYSHATPFRIYDTGKSKYSINHNVVSSVTRDKSGVLLVGTEGGGFNYVDDKKGIITNFRAEQNSPAVISSNLVKGIAQDNDQNLWIATHLGGLNRYDPAGRKFSTFRHNPQDPFSLSSDNVSAVMEDSKGRIWVGTDQQGADLLDPKSGKFSHFKTSNRNPFKLSGNFVRNFYEDSKGNVWIGTTEGLNMLPADSSRIIWFSSTSKSANRFPAIINCVREDGSGILWIGSFYGGLTRFDRKSNTFVTYKQKHGLPNDNVLGILDDDQGNLWLSTSNGLSRFDTKKQNFKNYTVTDGLPGNEFTPNTFYKDKSGEMFFGGLNGLVSFFPDAIQVNEFVAPVVLTSLKLFNRPVVIGAADGLLSKDISLTKEITFSHDQNIFSIDFALLNFIKSDKNTYAYRLEGFEKDWNYVRTSSASYTNLPSGTYKFVVKGANNDGVWSTKAAQMIIHVTPPMWATWWAYCLYVLVVAAVVLFVTRYFYMSALFRREHELYQIKLDFFTNISHEIRTHLTLIQGPVERLILIRKEDSIIQSHLGQVRKNAERLLRLVSELMDFRRAETSHLRLQVTQNNLVSFLKDIFHDFSLSSEHRDITSVFESNVERVDVYFDVKQMEKVVFNILSNAYKFTQDGGRVELLIEEKQNTVDIRISDNGKGIAPQYLNKLFVNFFQVYDQRNQNTGYGIGLALSKSITELHKGILTVESRPAEDSKAGNTCFTISLLKGNAHFEASELSTDIFLPEMLAVSAHDDFEENASAIFIPGEKPNILLVEDNAEIRAFLAESLQERYEIIQAENGGQGWLCATELIPDLIVSDVMMEEMDGLTLCRKLKTDERTSHIPIILLTAKASVSHQISGLKIGADVYIPKPFSIQVLELNLRNLLSARELMRQKYSRQVTLEPQNIVINSTEEQFLSKVMLITEDLMDNPEFGVAMLAEKIGMSQSVIYKKLKAITGMSVIDFLKSIRLKKAAQLLQEHNMTVYEVAYAVGYDDRKYFSKEFKKQFGKTPSEYSLAG